MYNVIGIDQSTDKVGWGIINSDGELIDYGCISVKAEMKEMDVDSDWEIARIAYVRDRVDEIIKQYSPKLAGLEDTVLVSFSSNRNFRNVGVLKTLTKCLGILECNFFDHDLDYIIFNNSEWRKGKIKGGDRIAKKRNAVKYVNNKYNIDLQWFGDYSKKNDDDIAEAIIIAECVLERAKVM